MEKIRGIVDEELQKLQSSPPDTHELERAINQIEASFYGRMERVGGFGGVGDQLNAYFADTGNPDYFNEDLSRYRALAPSDIEAAAAILASARPTGGTDRGARQMTAPPVCQPRRACFVTCAACHLRVPAAGARPLEAAGRRSGTCAARARRSTSARSSNGLQVWIVPSHKVPLVHLQLATQGWKRRRSGRKVRSREPDRRHARRRRRQPQRARDCRCRRLSGRGPDDRRARTTRRTSICIFRPPVSRTRCRSWRTSCCGRPSQPRSSSGSAKERLTRCSQAQDDPEQLIQLRLSAPALRRDGALRHEQHRHRRRRCSGLTADDLKAFHDAKYRPCRQRGARGDRRRFGRDTAFPCSTRRSAAGQERHLRP